MGPTLTEALSRALPFYVSFNLQTPQCRDYDSQLGHLHPGSQDGEVVEPGFAHTHVNPQEHGGQENAVSVAPGTACADGA